MCFSEQIFCRKQSLAASDVLGVKMVVPGTVSSDDSQLFVVGTKVSLHAKKELLENAKFDFRSSVKG